MTQSYKNKLFQENIGNTLQTYLNTISWQCKTILKVQIILSRNCQYFPKIF